MATFRCKRSGNTVTFKYPDDIEGMRKHEGYVEVVDEPKNEGQAMIAEIMQKAEARKPGRPKKVA